MAEFESEHVKCGGKLKFHHKNGRKSLFLCDKCGQLVNCCLSPSYKQYEKRAFYLN